MPTTPISVSLGIQGTTNTTLYTVPAGRTAICKAVVAQAAGNTNQAFTISKTTNGQNYPLNMNQNTYSTPATGGTEIRGVNLITAPITLGAGDQIKAYTNSSSLYNFPSVASVGSQFAADGSTASINYIKYGNGIYMAVGSCTAGGFVSTSTDCVTWTQKTAAIPISTSFSSVEYANGIWVGIKQNATGSIFYSTDNGNTWTFATGVTSYSPTQVYTGNNIFVISVAGNVIYSTNGSTWTAATGLSTFTAQTGYGVSNVGWTGSHWIVSNSYGSLATTDFTNWSGFGGAGFMQNNTQIGWSNLTYSSAYGKYYGSKSTSAVPNIGTSTTGILWDRTTVAMTVGKVAIAGSNAILIACPATNSAARFKSTDGSTWTSGTDSLSYTGRVWGLANGYFLTFQDNSVGTCYLSTDPVAGTGNVTYSNAASRVSRSAAADPITGKWCALIRDGDNNRWAMFGGSTANTFGSEYNPSIIVDSTNGNPMAVAWSAADSAFYAVSDTGAVFRSTAYNSTWTLVNSGTIVSFYNSGVPYAIKVVGTNIYVFVANNSTYANSTWVGSTLTGGSSFTGYNIGTYHSSAYWRPVWLGTNGQYPYDSETASNGTNLFVMTGTGAVTGFTPSASITSIVTPPTTTGTMQQLGGFTITYGAEYVNNSTTMNGWYYSTNVITTLGTYSNGQGYYLQGANIPPNKILYLSGTYYFNSFSTNAAMLSGTTPANASNPIGVGSSVAGTKIVNPTWGFTSDGTNMVGSTTQLDFTMNTTTPSAFLYAATVTASVVEIS